MKHRAFISKTLMYPIVVFVILLILFAILWSYVLTVFGEGDFIFLIEGVDFKDQLLLGVGIVGAILIGLLSLIVYYIVSGNRRANYIANQLFRDALESQQMLMQLYQESPIPYCIISPNGSIQLPNTAATRLLGSQSDELEDRNIRNYFPEEHRSRLDFFLAGLSGSRPVKEEEIEIIRGDGSRRWVLLSLFPLRTVRRGMKGNGIIAFVDITERKEVDRAKTEFVSLASHQLRTPLAAIKWYSELLLSSDLGGVNEKQQKYLNKIYKSNERMIELVSMLLNVSRFELGTQKIEKTPTVAVDIIEDVLEELEPSINEKRLKIDRSYVELPHFVTDQKLFHMIAQNLISNAVKYTESHGRVRVALSNLGDQVEFIVEDNGMGIPKEEQDKVFSKLFRASNAQEKVAVGTGLGLYIVKQAAESLGGGITFTSASGKGTSFKVTLPK